MTQRIALALVAILLVSLSGCALKLRPLIADVEPMDTTVDHGLHAIPARNRLNSVARCWEERGAAALVEAVAAFRCSDQVENLR